MKRLIHLLPLFLLVSHFCDAFSVAPKSPLVSLRRWTLTRVPTTALKAEKDVSSSSSSGSLGEETIPTTTTTSEEEPQQTRSQQKPQPSSIRRIDSIQRFARLPVWPVWNGLFIFVISRLLGNDIAAKVEDAIGGRVCPNFFNDVDKTSPFIMLVHHCHSFAAWDPLRYFQRALILPEGFPSHPHRGFITLTYFLKGGFVHRDSMGIKQTYGADQPRHKGKHVQYLMTGAGLLHEEMFDIYHDNPILGVSRQELYQLWLNIPAAHKLDPPFVQLVGGPDETPTVVTTGTTENQQGAVETIVLAGEYQGHQSAARLFSDVSIFHVKLLKGGESWHYNLPPSHATALLYIRAGTIVIQGQEVGPHNTVYFGTVGKELVVQSSSSSQDGADFIFLSGEPLGEPVAPQGSMVMNSGYEINEAYMDYQAGKMGRPWSEKLSEEEWNDHVQKYPSIYR